MSQVDTELDLKQIYRFFERKVSRYIFLVIDDQRILKDFIAGIQNRSGKKKKKVAVLDLNEENPSVYFQVKEFLDKDKCDGLIITGLNSLIYKYSHETIHLLNKSRDGFEDFSIPMAFVVNKANLKKIINGASDFYQLRDLPDFHFEGAASKTGEMNRDFLNISVPQPYDFEDSSLKAQLLEEQLEKARKNQRINDDALNDIVVPLLSIYIGRSYYKEAEALYDCYLKGRESKIKDKQVFLDYLVAMIEIGKIKIHSKDISLKYKITSFAENLIDLRRDCIRAEEWDRAAEITFVLQRYFTLIGSHMRSMELLRGLKMTKISKRHQAIAYIRMGNLHKDIGEYDNALSLYKKGAEIAEKNNDRANTAALLHQIGRIYHEAGRYEDALTQYEKSLDIMERIGIVSGISGNLHQIGLIYEEKGRYQEALVQYKKSLEISEEIGNIGGMASTMARIGVLHSKRNELKEALKSFIRAFLMFDEIDASYNVRKTKEKIAGIREKMPENKFNEILAEFGVEESDIRPFEDLLNQLQLPYAALDKL